MKLGSELSELISRMDQSLKEQSEKSIVQILDSSAEEMLRRFCDSPVQSPEPQEVSASSVLHEEPATEGPETSVSPDPFST